MAAKSARVFLGVVILSMARLNFIGGAYIDPTFVLKAQGDTTKLNHLFIGSAFCRFLVKYRAVRSGFTDVQCLRLLNGHAAFAIALPVRREAFPLLRKPRNGEGTKRLKTG